MSKAICEIRRDFFKGGRAYKRGEKTGDFSAEQAAGYPDYLVVTEIVREQNTEAQEQNNTGSSFRDNIKNTNIHSFKIKKGGKKK